jgi:hypothetical protein
MRLERDIMKSVQKRLSIFELTGEVVWFTRLNSGHIKTYFGSHIKLCHKGTWDWVVIFRNRNNGLSLLFIECKSDTGKIEKDQNLFKNKYTKEDVYFLLVREPFELDVFIDKYAKDFVNALPKNLNNL